MKTKHLWWGLVGMAMAGVSLAAQGASLSVGDKAPKLEVSKWVQGEPVKEFEKDKVYIVEFWATWCGPCRVSIPHLNELHQKFKDKGLIVIGQDVWENEVEDVAPFIKKMGDKMTYRVALDTAPNRSENSRGKMADNWMTAANQKGIPAAFVVEQSGKIAWIGHPMQLKEAFLEEILAGKFNLEKAAAGYAKEKANEEALDSIWKDLNLFMKNEKWADAETKLDEAEKLVPEADRDGLHMTRMQMLLGKKDYEAAQKLAEKLSNDNQDNFMLQNAIAWELATTEESKKVDLALVEKIARRANEASEGKDPQILDTLARIVFMRGDEKKAIELQQKAVNLSEGDLKEQLQTVLNSYKDGKLPEPE